MTDPTDPLAHLYGDFALEPDDEELELPVVETSVDDLNAELDPEREEQISDHDLRELVLLVRLRLEAGGLSDEEAAELGLGEIVEAVGADLDRELVLNATGRAVLKVFADEKAGGLA